MSAILIIDDNPDDREQYASFLEEAEPGLTIVSCHGGSDGMAAVNEHAFDCVLLDLRLDGEDGIDVLSKIRDVRPGLPVVVFTGQGSEQAAVDAFVAGAAYYLPKDDLTAKALWTAVERVIQKASTDRELKSKREALERSNRLDAIGQLAAGIAHDFNNQLGALRYCIELLKEAAVSDKLKDRVRTALKIIDDSGNLATRMVSLSQQGNLLAVDVTLHYIFSDVKALASASVSVNVTVDVRMPKSDLTVFCDPGQLLNAILNLILNANDAIVAKGEVGTVSIRVEAEVEKLCIVVKDNGIGMSEELVAKSTDPFFTTKQDTNGTGLGLAMVQAFANDNNGELLIYSTEGIGTKAVLVLPVGKEIDQPIKDDTALQAQQSEPAHILIVEDKFLLAMMTKEILEDEGFTAETVRDAEGALELISSASSVDVVLTDIGLPGMNGFELANQLKKQNPEIGIIYVTGYASNPDYPQHKLHGPVLQKPAEPKELIATINQVVSRK